jgi:CheY-like chemotaxis protein
MGAKRALIVDDSRSARAFLSRILEKYEIDVDSAESAEQAIEYLGHHRPDVIFMDHMMPGMDGFQAVQVIKNNPRTAMIPIMMYTSQEGELYLGQARALGAVGVLPKQIKPADVSKVLYQLHLVPDRRMTEQATFRPMVVGSSSANTNSVEVLDTPEEPSGPPLPPIGSKPLTDAALRELFAELRRAFVASLDSQTERIAADVRQMLQGSQAPQGLIADFSPSQRPSAARPWGWVAAAVAAILAVASGALLWQATTQQRALMDELEKLRAASAANNTPNEARNSPVASSVGVSRAAQTAVAREPQGSATAKPIIELVPYGSEPLSGTRLEITRQLFNRLSSVNYRGAVDIKVFSGRFCLIGNTTDGYSLPPDETLYAKCDMVGPAFDDSVSPAKRMPIAYANLIGAFRNSTRGAVDVQVASGDPTVTVVPYPQVSDALTAGEWNRAGSANNRIEIRVR